MYGGHSSPASKCRNMMKVITVIFVVFLAVEWGVGQEEDNPLVVDAGILGLIRGSYGNTYEENGVTRRYVQFRGIPYAFIPQRFSPSILREEDLWGDDTFNATTSPPNCFQPLLPTPFLTEDCLVVNVYTHQKDTGNDTELRPVLFFIHGGAFTVGSGASFSGIRMLNRDVVYVSFNYRLGLLGFYSLQNEDIPGNAGMYDVVNALNWTNKYIKHFGGDPNAITIAGQSAGSVSVTQLMASPMAQGLFHGAIAASGSAFNAWGTTTDPLSASLVIANRTGCHDLDTAPDLTAISTCMRSMEASKFVTVLYDYQVYERQQGRLGFDVVSPVVQNFPMTRYEKFLPEHARDVFLRGDESRVPLMMSSTKHDGSYVLGVFYNRFLKDNGLENNSTFLRHELIHFILNSLNIPDNPKGIHESISRMYMGDARDSGDFQEMYPGLMDIFSVFFFKGDAFETAMLHSSRAPTYWYSFDFRGSVSLFASLFPSGEVPPFPGGVTHSDDLIYLYGLTFLPFTEEERAVSYKMTSTWANFVTNGSPNVDWPVLDPNADTQMYRSILGAEDVSVENYAKSWVGPGYDAHPPTQPPLTTTPVRVTTTFPPSTGSSSLSSTTTPTSDTTPSNNATPTAYNLLSISIFTLLLLLLTH